MTHTSPQTVLIIGASSGIAKQFVEHVLAAEPTTRFIRVSRSKLQSVNEHCVDLNCDNSHESIAQIVKQRVLQDAKIDQVFMFNGVLHNDTVHPEKHLGALTEHALHAVFHANAVTPMLWLQQLKPLLHNTRLICLLSARIGSIGDNQLGGWYSYRASKAALNMLVKSAYIELKRNNPSVSVLLYHPGTTDTTLSKPFQKNVPSDQLFSPSQAADYLYTVSQAQLGAANVQFLDWQGNTIEW